METKISKAQLEVWEWKEKAYNKIKDLPKGKVLSYIIADTKEIEEQIKEYKRKHATQKV